MKQRTGSPVVLAIVMSVAFGSAMLDAQGQTAKPPMPAAKPYTPPKTTDGQPDISGMWSGVPGGSVNIQDMRMQPLGGGVLTPELAKKLATEPPVSRVFDPPDGKIPYQPWAAEKREFLFKHFDNPTVETLDPSARCWLHGVPRHLYNRELEIMQAPGYVIFFNMAHHAYRTIPVDGKPHIPANIKLFMGDSRGRWEGNTLVVDVTNNNDQTWLDIVGDFHSDQYRVQERFTVTDADTIEYEATITDPKAYTRPWKMKLALKRNKDYGDELWEEACYESSARSIEGMLTR